jgi:hypothetical protein
MTDITSREVKDECDGMVNVLVERLENLMGDINFKSEAMNSTEKLLVIGQHYFQEYRKIAATDKDRHDRIKATVLDLLTSVLQIEASKKNVNINKSSIHEIIHDLCKNAEKKEFTAKLVTLARQSLIKVNLTDELQWGVSPYFERLPSLIALIGDILEDTIMEKINEDGIVWLNQKQTPMAILRVKTTATHKTCFSRKALWDSLLREEDGNGK